MLGLKDSSPKGDQHLGKVWLGITTSGDGGPVVEYERCARDGRGTEQPGHDDDIPGPSDPTPLADLLGDVPGWDLSDLPASDWGPATGAPTRCATTSISPPPLARLTFNQAAVHRDATTTANGQRAWCTAATCRALPRRR